MEFIFTREMQDDLREVNNTFQRSLLPWWDEISIYVPEADRDLGYKLLPAMVINAYRYLGIERELTIQMANIFKTINFANIIHILAKDDEEGQIHNQELQFAILIGDYIFGRVLKLLLEADADKLLNIFATMICSINEGLVIKHTLHGGLEDVLTKTRAPLYTNAFLTAGKMAGLKPETAEIYSEIGHNLGMAVELIYIYHQEKCGRTYLYKAQSLMGQLQDAEVLKIGEMEALMQQISNNTGGDADGL
jgi:geranylgeranyl pyrophosphate synthase